MRSEDQGRLGRSEEGDPGAGKVDAGMPGRAAAATGAMVEGDPHRRDPARHTGAGGSGCLLLAGQVARGGFGVSCDPRLALPPSHCSPNRLTALFAGCFVFLPRSASS